VFVHNNWPLDPTLRQMCQSCAGFYNTSAFSIHTFYKLYISTYITEWCEIILSSWLCKTICFNSLQHEYSFLSSILCVIHNITWFYVTLYSVCFWHNAMFWAKFFIHFPLNDFTPELVATKYHASVVGTPTLYPWGLRFESHSRGQLSWLRLWWSLVYEKMLHN
jgi:hypothetical protein